MTKQTIYDAAVIGAGPAGATAAYYLARAGAKTLLLEKEAVPRYKTCGGGVTGRALSFLPIDIETVTENHCYRVEMTIADANLHFVTQRKQPVIRMVMRDRFDAALVRAAKDRGAELHTGCPVLNIRSGNDTVELMTKDCSFFARFLIAADGALSVAVKALGDRHHRYRIPTLEYEVQVDDDTFNRHRAAARFDFGSIPRGYGWVFPKSKHLSIGLGTALNHKGPVNLHECLRQYMASLGIQPLHIERHGFIIPIRTHRGPLFHGRTLFAGDAAGLADPITAEGISPAVISGYYAAESLLHANFDQDAATDLYQQNVEKNLFCDFRTKQLLAHLFYGAPALRNYLFRHHGQRLCETVTDIQLGEKSYPSFPAILKILAKMFLLKPSKP
ncbi:MAG: geranylgeranyl reductase family protein [Candidatus Omnitrophica bacterium]|nr:geranylgeranyl reductase family protein [Candidatus Omnitrophota bacterium]MDD5672000.1 geranylgeranyl reductase family protein [Candidatus Omnitrophota bacterium]